MGAKLAALFRAAPRVGVGIGQGLALRRQEDVQRAALEQTNQFRMMELALRNADLGARADETRHRFEVEQSARERRQHDADTERADYAAMFESLGGREKYPAINPGTASVAALRAAVTDLNRRDPTETHAANRAYDIANPLPARPRAPARGGAGMGTTPDERRETRADVELRSQIAGTRSDLHRAESNVPKRPQFFTTPVDSLVYERGKAAADSQVGALTRRLDSLQAVQDDRAGQLQGKGPASIPAGLFDSPAPAAPASPASRAPLPTQERPGMLDPSQYSAMQEEYAQAAQLRQRALDRGANAAEVERAYQARLRRIAAKWRVPE